MRLREGSGTTAPETVASALPDSEDKELVLAFKRGEDGSYQAIYERYSPRVAGICRRMLNQAQDAEEAQQEAFMRVYTSLHRFNGRYQLGAWVSRIATNVCLDHIRSKGRRPAESADHEMLVDLSIDPGDNVPEEELLKNDERKKVRDVLATLSPSHRAALALREFEGMSYDDIAVALNMTEPQVKALIHRARKAFKKQWAPGLAALLPWKWIAKARKFSSHYDAPPQLSDAAASTMHFASSCSVALQHCGQFVSERVATTFTALVVGTAAVGVALAPSGRADLRKPVIHEQAVTEKAREDETPGSRKTADRERGKKVVAVAERPTEEPVDSSPPAPAPQPTTAPEETTTPGEPTTTEPTPPGDSSEPRPPVGPAPLYTYFGWQGTQSTPRAQATSSSLVVDCTRNTLTHEVQTMISHGAFSYPMTMRFESSATATRMGFSVFKDAREIAYASWGQDPLATWSHNGDSAVVEITGGYGARYGYDPVSVGLPESGAFDATLTLDCATQTVIAEGAAFTVE